jgi:hypothetical protein
MKNFGFLTLGLLWAFASIAQDDTIRVNSNLIRFGHDNEERIYISTDSRIKEDFKKKITVEQRIPVELNGKRIFFDSTGTAIANGQRLFEAFLRILDKELKALPEGNYSLDLSQVVLDASGSVVYLDTVYNCRVQPRNYSTNVPVEISRSVLRKMSNELLRVKLSPAKYKGKVVPSLVLNPFVAKTLYVKEGTVTVY